MKKTIETLAISSAALLIAGCSSSPNLATAGSDGATVSQTAAAPESIPTSSGGQDKTSDFTTANASAAWKGQIKSVVETEPGRITIETTIVDPRGTDGSKEAKVATEICESAVSLFGPSYVAVKENDGTHFVLFGHPSVPKGTCAEV